MRNKLLLAYRKLRYLPRHIITTLDRINAGVEALRRQRESSFIHTSASMRDIQAEITLFCDETTKVMLGLLASENAAAKKIASMEGRLSSTESLLRDLAEALQAHRREAAEVPAGTDARLNGLDLTLHGLGADVRHLGAAIGDLDKTMQFLGGSVEAQAKQIAQLGTALSETARIYPSWPWTPEVAEQVRSIMSLLQPVSVPGVGKTRLGRDRDGGYVMLDDFTGTAAALSLGIADDVSWDTDIANRGVKVFQFDPTVSASPASHELFSFEPLRVAPQDGDGAVTLDTIVETRIESADAPLVLKIDIEGDEWPVFLGASEATMQRFRQIVCEFHNLERLGEDMFASTARDVFAKLARTHFVYHVHGNNCANFTNVGNVVVPQSLEVSFGLRSSYSIAESTEPFPTPLDFPNEPGRADLYLGNFRFGNGAHRHG